MKSVLANASDLVGMPDDEDKKVLQRLILKFEKKHPGWIQNTRNEARRDMFEQGKSKYALANKEAQGQVVFELPEELHRWIEDYLPSLFSDPKHFSWFKKNFKELMVPEKTIR